MSKLTRWPLSRNATEHLLRAWNAGRLAFLRESPGTAAPSVVAVTSRGQYLLKQRSPRYSGRLWVSWDHSVLGHLARQGLPVVVPVKTTSGSRWLAHDDHLFELYPWVEGDPYTSGDPTQTAAAGQLLARLHRATEGFQPTGRKNLPRLFHPTDRLPEIAEARRLLEAGADPGPAGPERAALLLDYLQTTAQAVLRRLPDRTYWALPQAIIHGDYHPANLKFHDGEIVGLFDFDWTCRQARVKDVADGVLFFAPRERPLAADLEALTQPPRFDLKSMRVFLDAYQGEIQLTAAEAKALPDLLRERWLYVRLDAMHRKLPDERKLAFLLPEVELPLRWLDEYEQEVVALCRKPRK